MTEIFRDSNAPLEARVGDLLGRLSLEEKVRLLSGSAWFELHGIERLGVPTLSMTDGPTGVRSNAGDLATVFPVGVALAASWNPETVRLVAGAIAREAIDLGQQVVLAPTINIMRTPTWGRNFETYSEDPFLAARIGVAYVQGLQAEGIGASLKHYAANNQELERFEVDARPDERTLREIYLYAFETIVREADPWSVMASYNRVHGQRASENRRLLTKILKDEWGYTGVAVSDWGAVRSTGAAGAGLDLEMPGPAHWFGDKLLAAVRDGTISQSQIEDNSRRVVRLIIRSGLIDRSRPRGERRTPRHRMIALEAAIDGMTLLKNDGLLPLSTSLGCIALIGPNARGFKLQGGGSSQVVTDAAGTLADAFRQFLGDGVQIIEAQGADNDIHPPIPHAALFSPTEDRGNRGLEAEYFEVAACAGTACRTDLETSFVRRVRSGVTARSWSAYGSVRWSGWLWPPTTGTYEFSVRATGAPELFVGGERLIDPQTASRMDAEDVLVEPVPRRLGSTRLQGGRGYPFRLEYTPLAGGNDHLGLGVRLPVEPLAKAVEAARAAQAVVLVLGSGAATESEGYDRPDLDLPGEQDALARAVLAANPRTVVVMNAGAPFSMPWAGDVRALLQTWLPGESGPEALVQVLFGKAEPGGRLPVSWPARFGDHAAHALNVDPRICDYAEGLLVGYRYYDEAGVAPLFPFGHGLGYTTFEFSDLVAPSVAATNETVQVEVTVKNVGDRPGREVVQLYVAPLSSKVRRPPKELKGLCKVSLQPGSSRRLSLELRPREFAHYDPEIKRWVTEGGEYELLVGRSAADIRQRAKLTLR